VYTAVPLKLRASVNIMLSDVNLLTPRYVNGETGSLQGTAIHVFVV
jgi:hypothetical protein